MHLPSIKIICVFNTSDALKNKITYFNLLFYYNVVFNDLISKIERFE